MKLLIVSGNSRPSACKNLTCNGPQEYVKLKGLDPQMIYSVNDGELLLSGAALMYAGIPIEREVTEYTSFQFHLKQKS